MKSLSLCFAAFAMATVGAAGCGQQAPPASPTSAAPGANSAYRLATEPAGAADIKAARISAGDGDDVTVVGRIGGDAKPWVDGLAAFTIVDLSIKPCQEGCPTPWDYCCDLDQLPEAKAMIKVVDSQGKTEATDARQLLGLKELQTVVVRGKAKRDEAGNLTVLADGIFVRP